MRIVCPACAAAYEVPDGRLAPGRVVRCARCETDWAPIEPVSEPDPEPEPVAPAPVPQTVAEPEPAAPEPAVRAPVSVPPRRNWALRVAWVLSLAAVAAAAWGAYAARDAVMHAWPPSVRAYAALGLVARH